MGILLLYHLLFSPSLSHFYTLFFSIFLLSLFILIGRERKEIVLKKMLLFDSYKNYSKLYKLKKYDFYANII